MPDLLEDEARCPQCAYTDPIHSRSLPNGWEEWWCPICGVMFPQLTTEIGEP